MEETSYVLGKLVGTPVVVALITFGVMRLMKKRKLTGREITIVAAAGLVAFILILLQNVPAA